MTEITKNEINYLLLLIHNDLKTNDSVFENFFSHKDVLQLMDKLKKED